MIYSKTDFKVRLLEHPIVMRDGQKTNYGRFNIKKKYRVYSVFDNGDRKTPTQFLLADEDGKFLWLAMGICRRV